MNSTQLTTNFESITSADQLNFMQPSATNRTASGSWAGKLYAGDVVRPHDNGSDSGGDPDNTKFTVLGIVSDVEAAVTQEVEASNTFSARIANNGTATITSEGQTFISSVNRSAVGRVDVTFVSGFFIEIPGIEITITDGGTNRTIAVDSLTTSGCQVQINHVSDSLGRDNDFSITVHRQETDFRSPLQPRLNLFPIAYIKDVKSSGTNGGGFTSGAWQTRDLNTLEGDSFVTLSSDQFTLPPGKYQIEAKAPGYKVADHKIKLVSDPDGSPVDEIIGTSAQTAIGDGVLTESTLMGVLEIASPTTYELQHRSAATQASNGFGTANSFGVNEVYSQIKIIKIK